MHTKGSGLLSAATGIGGSEGRRGVGPSGSPLIPPLARGWKERPGHRIGAVRRLLVSGHGGTFLVPEPGWACLWPGHRLPPLQGSSSHGGGGALRPRLLSLKCASISRPVCSESAQELVAAARLKRGHWGANSGTGRKPVIPLTFPFGFCSKRCHPVSCRRTTVALGGTAGGGQGLQCRRAGGQPRGGGRSPGTVQGDKVNGLSRRG